MARYRSVQTEYSAGATTSAPPERVWQALIDVSDWLRWTPSYTSIRRLDEGPLTVGSRARVKQPRLAATIVEVTELDPGRAFTCAFHHCNRQAAGTAMTAMLSR